ncbi:MAG: hypothetical protein BAJALOKI3v1_530001 [Promethearchaeota archaeon]|nr:MAG: hypothetical protein BAJALOKI3v1_530001 [Candidatus Lokiarchaeota archaeon]
MKQKAPPDLKKILPQTPGEMEMGYEKKEQKFYFLMEDPEFADVEEIHILAITIDADINIEMIKDFDTDKIM